MRFSHLINLLLIVFLASCNQGSNTNDIAYELVQQPDKIFQLDNETAYDRIEGQIFTIDNILYYTFFNRETHSIYFYNYNSATLKHKIKLTKEGPNAVLNPYYAFYYWVYDLDTIFINTHKYYYVINRKGEVIKKIDVIENADFFKSKSLSLDRATYLKNNKLHCGINIILPDKGQPNLLRGVYNLDTETFEKEYLKEQLIVPDYNKVLERLTKMSKSGGMSTIAKHFVGDEKAVYASSAINDSIYEFKNNALINKYYAGNPNIKTTNYEGFFNKTKVETFEGGGVRIGPKAIQPPFYTDMFIDPESKWVYRVLIHGTKAVIHPETKNEIPEVFGASLIAFNTSDKSSFVLEIPIDKIDIAFYQTNIFVAEEGIHFPVKDPENENEKRYAIFKLE